MEKKLWFRAKTFGWGWTPCTWEGWTVLFAFLALEFLNVRLFAKNSPSGDPLFLGITFALIAGLLLICYKKGEKPHWSWGRKKTH